MTLLLIQIMNPNSKELIPNHPTESFYISTEILSRKQAQIFQELILEWTTTPTLNTLLENWEKTAKMQFQVDAYAQLKIVSSKRIVKLFQLWKSGVELTLTVWCGPWCAHYLSISQNPSTVYIK
ncbi:unnamed protein product [Rotaria magnacalcarata]|uniref:Uncharacterized protein n=1 Tax=Rotaria magnacalcarata TaxID=392030 RepID=A0A820CH24_9BILA|nr:unnamed protein product [Rotaria magnacalcarata]